MKKNIIALLIGLMSALIIAEIIFRVMLPQNIEKKKMIKTEINMTIGALRTPNQKGAYIGNCYEINEINYNSNGFRDNNIVIDQDMTIGILGDSYMEATQIPEGIHTSALMEEILGVDVINMSIDGANTFKELLFYTQKMRPYRPKIVLLFFMINDVAGNSCALQKKSNKLSGTRFSGLCGTSESDNVKFVNFIPPANKQRVDKTDKILIKTRNTLRRLCTSCIAFKSFLKTTFKVNLDLTGKTQEELFESYYNVYIPTASLDPTVSGEWIEAWQITEYVLALLNKEIKNDGGKLIVISVPEHLRISKEWNKELKNQNIFNVPKTFDPFHPLEQLRKITQKNSITFLSLEDYFIEYRDKFNLAYPYLSYRCDGHWNPLGHLLAASIASKFLIENGFVQTSADIKRLKAIEKILNESPENILGDKAYGEIYGRTIFKSKTNILEFINTSALDNHSVSSALDKELE